MTVVERRRVHEMAPEPMDEPALPAGPSCLPAAHQTAPAAELVDLVVAFRNAGQRQRHADGAHDVLAHLMSFPAETWLERWSLFEATIGPGTAWQELVVPGGTPDRQQRLVAPVLALIANDVVRPSYAWMQGGSALLARVGEWRDAEGVEIVRASAAALNSGLDMQRVAIRALAQVQARTGKTIRQLDAADLLAMRDVIYKVNAGSGLPLAWRALHTLGWITHDSLTLPPRRRHRQKTCQELVATRGISGPVAEVLTEYLKHRSAGLDYPTRQSLARNLVKLYWADMLQHHPDLTSFAVTREQIDGWRQRLVVKADGTPRAESVAVLFTVRAFYLDMSQWALQDSYWVRWVAPSPIYFSDLKGYKKARRRVIAATQHRTRELAPALPKLVETAENERRRTAAALHAAQTAGHGGTVDLDGRTWSVVQLNPHSPFRLRRGDQERNLSEQEDNAFWAWAIIEVLRHTGIRHEEMLELTHLAVQPYKIPATGETVPLLHIAPSKVDEERLLVASPELVHVLHQVIARLRNGSQSVPLSQRWDPYEKTLGEPMPHLFAKRVQTEYRVISPGTVLTHIQRTARLAGITANGQPARVTPVDMRRIFATEALASGLPPHIVQVLMGHKNIGTTQGYAAIYPADVIRHHRTFIAQRRHYRPSEEYREPTAAEWEEFQAHFVTRKVSLGSCGRAYGTSCHHEHACVRCALLRPDPAQTHRLVEIVANLGDRITEATDQGWLGEVEGLQVTLDAAQHKLRQMQRLQDQPAGPTLLGMPSPARRSEDSPTRIKYVSTTTARETSRTHEV